MQKYYFSITLQGFEHLCPRGRPIMSVKGEGKPAPTMSKTIRILFRHASYRKAKHAIGADQTHSGTTEVKAPRASTTIYRSTTPIVPERACAAERASTIAPTRCGQKNIIVRVSVGKPTTTYTVYICPLKICIVK